MHTMHTPQPVEVSTPSAAGTYLATLEKLWLGRRTSTLRYYMAMILYNQ